MASPFTAQPKIPGQPPKFPDPNGDPRVCPVAPSESLSPGALPVIAPKMCRQNDVAPWLLSEAGKRANLRFSAKRPTDVFYTCGTHNVGNEIAVNPDSRAVEFMAKETNCLGYALGRPMPKDIDLKLDNTGHRFNPIMVATLFDSAKRQLRAKLAQGKGFQDFVLPFGAPVEQGYVAIDMWNGMTGGWHATRRANVNGQTVIVSKDGKDFAVENFSSSDSLTTNAGIGYRAEPMYTMLIPEWAMGNWAALSAVFK